MIGAVHALIGASLGRLARRPLPAFLAGVSSHLLGDLVPHKDFPLKVEAPLAAVTFGFLAWKFGVRSPEFIGACGAVAPDAENAAMMTGLVPREKMLFPTHRPGGLHGPETASRVPQFLIAAACLAFLLGVGAAWTTED